MTEIVDTVKQVIEPIATKQKLELVDVEYTKEHGTWYLRVYLDKSGGIDIEEIAAASDLISEQLDLLEPDPFVQPYMLEVSSPGIERPIKNSSDWQQAIGQYIHLGLYQAIAKSKIFEGTLLSHDAENTIIKIKDKTRTKELTIPNKLIANVRHAIEF